MSVIITIGGASALLGASGITLGSIAVGAVADKILSKLETERKVTAKVIAYPSIFKKINILQKTLLNLGANPKLTVKKNILAEIDGVKIECQFSTERKGIDIFFIDGEEKQANDLVKNIEEEYGNVIQELVYQKLKNDASKKGLELESEELTEDNSIVLTYAITNTQ